MSDPRRDPNFPDRPQSKDFWRMSEGVTALDHLTAAAPFDSVCNQLCDVEAVTYMAKGRVKIAAARLGVRPRDITPEGIWVDAFYQGLMFQKLGGHQAEG